MAKSRLTKPQKVLSAIIESEGASIVAYRTGGSHMKVDFTWDNVHFFTESLPYGKDLSRRWEHNFRAAIRKTKRQLSERNP